MILINNQRLENLWFIYKWSCSCSGLLMTYEPDMHDLRVQGSRFLFPYEASSRERLEFGWLLGFFFPLSKLAVGIPGPHEYASLYPSLLPPFETRLRICMPRSTLTESSSGRSRWSQHSLSSELIIETLWRLIHVKPFCRKIKRRSRSSQRCMLLMILEPLSLTPLIVTYCAAPYAAFQPITHPTNYLYQECGEVRESLPRTPEPWLLEFLIILDNNTVKLTPMMIDE